MDRVRPEDLELEVRELDQAIVNRTVLLDGQTHELRTTHVLLAKWNSPRGTFTLTRRTNAGLEDFEDLALRNELALDVAAAYEQRETQDLRSDAP